MSEDAGIDGTGLFIYEFFGLFQETKKDVRALKADILETGISKLDNFSIDSGSSKFGDLVEEVFGECEGQTDRESQIPDEEFRFVITDILSEMKECSRTSNDHEVLQFVMVFFTIVILLTYSVLNPSLFNLVWQ